MESSAGTTQEAALSELMAPLQSMAIKVNTIDDLTAKVQSLESGLQSRKSWKKVMLCLGRKPQTPMAGLIFKEGIRAPNASGQTLIHPRTITCLTCLLIRHFETNGQWTTYIEHAHVTTFLLRA
jgi:hypothetical protein